MKILDTVASRHLGEMHGISSWSGRAPKWASRIALENERYAELLEKSVLGIRFRGRVFVGGELVSKELSFFAIIHKNCWRFAEMVDDSDGQHYLLDPFYVLVAFEIISK